MTIRSHAPAQRSRVAILVALCLAAFIISVDVTIVNVALPTLVREAGGIHHAAPVDRRRLQPGVRRPRLGGRKSERPSGP